MTPCEDQAVYDRFRRAVSPVAESRLRFAPDLAARDWVVQCYVSKAAFDARFPSAQYRAAVVARLERYISGAVGKSRGEFVRMTEVGLNAEDRAALDAEADEGRW